MKKIFLLIVLLCSLTFGQVGWDSLVTSLSSVSSIQKTDLFTNKDGNHLLIRRGAALLSITI